MYRPRLYVEGKYALDFRSDARGGLVRSEPAVIGDVYRPRARHVLLVHGFNTVRHDARASYEQFREHLSKRLRTIDQELIYVYWPADWAVQYVSPLSYRRMVELAVFLGPMLARALMKFSGPGGANCELVIVAHSLGCRLALEALRALRADQVWQRFRIKLILLAAAIPVPLFGTRSEYDRTLGELVTTSVCFSDSDHVLGWAFRLAETRTGLFMPEAVGLHGAPARVWRSLQGLNLGHTQYWQSEEVARYVAERVGPTTVSAISRMESPRELPYRPDWASRELPERTTFLVPSAT